MKQRLTALLLLLGVIGVVGFGRAKPHFVSARASISAPPCSIELPPAIQQAPLVVQRPTVVLALVAPTPLSSALRSAPLYLENRSLLL